MFLVRDKDAKGIFYSFITEKVRMLSRQEKSYVQVYEGVSTVRQKLVFKISFHVKDAPCFSGR